MQTVQLQLSIVIQNTVINALNVYHQINVKILPKSIVISLVRGLVMNVSMIDIVLQVRILSVIPTIQELVLNALLILIAHQTPQIITATQDNVYYVLMMLVVLLILLKNCATLIRAFNVLLIAIVLLRVPTITVPLPNNVLSVLIMLAVLPNLLTKCATLIHASNVL